MFIDGCEIDEIEINRNKSYYNFFDIVGSGYVIKLQVEDRNGKITKEGKTIILSSHNPNHALFLESNVVLMDKGTIIKQGSCKEIIKVEVLQEIYGDNVCYSEKLKYKEISFQ